MELSQEVQTALVLILILSMPVVIVATVIGLSVGLVQALTQIQDQTLPHAIKLAAVTLTILAVGGVLSSRLLAFTVEVFDRIAGG
jgi:type III secretion HrpO family protein